jgi:hypothetical protein
MAFETYSTRCKADKAGLAISISGRVAIVDFEGTRCANSFSPSACGFDNPEGQILWEPKNRRRAQYQDEKWVRRGSSRRRSLEPWSK